VGKDVNAKGSGSGARDGDGGGVDEGVTRHSLLVYETLSY
jgi:hypothetical protein